MLFSGIFCHTADSKKWSISVQVLRLLRRKYISTLGFVTNIYISLKSLEKKHLTHYKDTKLVVTWFRGNNINNFYQEQKTNKCLQVERNKTEYKCLIYTFSQLNTLKRNFIVFKFYQRKNWNEASQICKDIGGYLPYFTNRLDLEELLSFLKLKLWKEIPIIYEIFIGLKYELNQVGCICVENSPPFCKVLFSFKCFQK